MPHSLVSVIIPVYNGERYLADAVESVLAQTHQPIELIIVDDGSTDASAQSAQAYGPLVRYVRQAKNISTGSARNQGVRLASGDYFAFLDQDDVWLSDKLALQIAAFDARPALEVVFGQVEQFRRSPQRRAPDAAPQVRGYAPSAMLIRQEAFRRVGPFATTLQIGEWVDWFARASDLKLKMLVLPNLVMRRRVHQENKGVIYRAARSEYARVLKASLDRRRAAGDLS
jgi:glycosyltransferase involved in cell wall biosynthesis